MSAPTAVLRRDRPLPRPVVPAPVVAAPPAPPGLLAAPGPALADHLVTHGPLPVADVAALAESAALTGRGGAAFPTAVKVRSVARAVARARRAPVVVANGAEGEPAALEDRVLLTRAPHLVLDGLALAGRTLGATTLVLAAAPATLPAVARALAERGDTVRLHPVAPSFVAGEESALVSGLQGRPALPREEEPPVRVQGVEGRPTLVLDVETLARLALLARGCADAADRALVTRRWEAAGVARADVVDVEPGSRLADVLPLTGARAVLVGGYRGTWVSLPTARSLTLDAADLAVAGVHLGPGVLAALPADRCGLLETARVVEHLARDSAGRCGSCLEGLPRIAAALAVLAAPATPPPGLLDELTRWSGPAAARGACPHSDGTVRLVASALELFAGELTAHRYGSCTATSWAPFLPVPADPG
ncbi:NADH-ubiquinone oxidoreductase-F iron-sulfur binding region domain-containing protein [Geodermatophilus sp. SYSU D00710]